MSDDFDVKARRAGERVRRRAVDLLDAAPATTIVERPRSTTRRSLVAGVAAMAIAALTVAVLARSNDGRSAHLQGSTVSAPPTSPVTTAPPVSATPTTTATTPTTTGPADDPLMRPVVDADICTPTSATSQAFERRRVLPFALAAVPEPIPIQVIGDPHAGATAPFIVVARFVTTPQRTVSTDTVEIAGQRVQIAATPNGNVAASWTLPDGSNAYLRAHRSDATTVEQVIAGLTPRAPSAAIPGFDVTPVGGSLQLIADQLNDAVGSESATLTCTVPGTSREYRITAIRGDAVARYLAVIDRPTPLDVAEVDGTVIVVTGVGALHAPTAADVHDATPEAWTALPQTAPAAPVSQAPGDVVLCDELPLAPAFLADGSPAGEGVDELGDNGHRRVHWGDGDAQVSQVLPSPNDAGVVGGEWFTLNEPENVFLDGRFVAAVHLVGDEGVGNSVVEIVDTAAGCGYLFDVGPDARLDVVRRLADALRTALTTRAGDLPRPASADDLVGARWLVIGDDSTDSQRVVEPWFRLNRDGSIDGSDGCAPIRAEGGSWRIADGRLTVSASTAPDAGCDDVATLTGGLPETADVAVAADGATITLSAGDRWLRATRLDALPNGLEDELAGFWSNASNRFEFQLDGTLRFSRESTCTGSYRFDESEALVVDFGPCDDSSIRLAAPIFRRAHVRVLPGNLALVLDGDAGPVLLRRTNA